MCKKTGPCSFMILLTLILALPVRSQDQAVLSDSALRVQITTNGVALFNGEWFIEATGYQKRDSTEIDTVIIMRKNMRIRVVATIRQLNLFAWMSLSIWLDMIPSSVRYC